MGELMLACTRRSPMSQMKNYLYLFVLPIALGAQPLSTLVDEALRNNREDPGGPEEI